MFYARFFTTTLAAILATGCGSEKTSEPKKSAAQGTSANAIVVPDAQVPAAMKAKPLPGKAIAEPTPKEIDALVRVATADGFKNMEPQTELWAALFHLEQWHLMTFPDSTSIPPGLNIETFEGKKWVMAFTDTDRLYEYANARKLLNSDGTMLGMSVPSQTSFAFFESLEGLEGVRFNEGKLGFFAPMGNLRAIHTHLEKLGRLPSDASKQASTP